MYQEEGVVYIIPVEEIPRSGQLIIAVHFKDYKDYYANETREALLRLPERRDVKSAGIVLYPLDYWLKRTIVTEKADEESRNSVRQRKKRGTEEEEKRWHITRATGGLYKIGFSGMTPDKFKGLYEILQRMKKTYWDEFEILIASRVEGF